MVEIDRGPRRGLLERIRAEIDQIAAGDSMTAFQVRRYIAKQLMYDERGTPTERKIKKALLYERQKGLCGLCGKPMEKKGNDLHRTHETWRGYDVDGPNPNTILLHGECHNRQQEERGYR